MLESRNSFDKKSNDMGPNSTGIRERPSLSSLNLRRSNQFRTDPYENVSSRVLPKDSKSKENNYLSNNKDILNTLSNKFVQLNTCILVNCIRPRYLNFLCEMHFSKFHKRMSRLRITATSSSPINIVGNIFGFVSVDVSLDSIIGCLEQNNLLPLFTILNVFYRFIRRFGNLIGSKNSNSPDSSKNSNLNQKYLSKNFYQTEDLENLMVFGSLNGNLEALLYFFKNRLYDGYNVLFTGNFTDSTFYSIEILVLLFQFALQYEKMVFIMASREEDYNLRAFGSSFQEISFKYGNFFNSLASEVIKSFPIILLVPISGVRYLFSSGCCSEDVEYLTEFNDEDRNNKYEGSINDILWSEPLLNDSSEEIDLEFGYFFNKSIFRGYYVSRDSILNFLDDSEVDCLVRPLNLFENKIRAFSGDLVEYNLNFHNDVCPVYGSTMICFSSCEKRSVKERKLLLLRLDEDEAVIHRYNISDYSFPTDPGSLSSDIASVASLYLGKIGFSLNNLITMLSLFNSNDSNRTITFIKEEIQNIGSEIDSRISSSSLISKLNERRIKENFDVNKFLDEFNNFIEEDVVSTYLGKMISSGLITKLEFSILVFYYYNEISSSKELIKSNHEIIRYLLSLNYEKQQNFKLLDSLLIENSTHKEPNLRLKDFLMFYLLFKYVSYISVPHNS